jgi:5'-nucleotidase
MPTILVTNDDGVDSPSLVPLARALEPFGRVRVVVPAVERSWIGKAITRFEPVQVVAVERDGLGVHAVSGSPADCVNLAVHTLYPEPPDVVVSGINLGLNFGLAFLLSSGTVGAALEAWIAALPSIAFSMAIPNDAYGLAGVQRLAALGGRPQAAAAVAADLVGTLLSEGFPPDVDSFSVNMPAEVTPRTPRMVGRVTRARYGRLFVPAAEGGYRHRFQSYWALEEPDDGDMQVVTRGAVAITPLRLDFTARLPARLHAALEQRLPESEDRKREA